MSSEEPEPYEQISGTDGAAQSKLSFWLLVLLLLAAQVPLVILGRVLHLSFDLPADSMIAIPSGIMVVCAVISAEPGTFRQLGRLAAIVVGVGILAMLCYLPVVLVSQGFMVRLLGGVFIAGMGVWIVSKACRRLGVPARSLPQSRRP